MLVLVAAVILLFTVSSSVAMAAEILVFGDFSGSRENLVADLTGLENSVTLMPTLPADLSPYDTVWHVSVPVAASVQGANNSRFSTDVWILNTGSQTATGTLTFQPQTGAAIGRPVSLGALESLVVRDVLESEFGISGNALGYLVYTPISGDTRERGEGRRGATRGDISHGSACETPLTYPARLDPRGLTFSCETCSPPLYPRS